MTGGRLALKYEPKIVISVSAFINCFPDKWMNFVFSKRFFDSTAFTEKEKKHSMNVIFCNLCKSLRFGEKKLTKEVCGQSL